MLFEPIRKAIKDSIKYPGFVLGGSLVFTAACALILATVWFVEKFNSPALWTLVALVFIPMPLIAAELAYIAWRIQREEIPETQAALNSLSITALPALWLGFLQALVTLILLANALFAYTRISTFMGIAWWISLAIWMMSTIYQYPLLIEHYFGYLSEQKSKRGGRRLIYQSIMLALENIPQSLVALLVLGVFTALSFAVPPLASLLWLPLCLQIGTSLTNTLLVKHRVIQATAPAEIEISDTARIDGN